MKIVKKCFIILSAPVVFLITLNTTNLNLDGSSDITIENLDHSKSVEALASIENYIYFLNGLGCEEATKVAEQVYNLSEAEQELFLNIMQPQNYIKVLKLASMEINTFSTLKIEGEEVSFSVVPTNQKRTTITNTPIVISFEEVNSRNVRGTRGEFTASQTFYLFGISTTAIYSTLIFTLGDNNHPIATVHASGHHRNWNPGIWVSPLSSGHFMDHEIARGETNFRFRLSAMPFVSHSVTLETRRNGLWNQQRVVSGNSNWNTNWHTVL